MDNRVTFKSMNGGNDHFSYTKNSTFQKKVIEATNELINKAVDKIDIKTLLCSKIIRIADLGCATGPNTFLAVQNIIDSLEHKFYIEQIKPNNANKPESIFFSKKKEEAIMPEFQVYFNDLVSNDFQQLFKSIPRETKYFAAGVPGSFHSPLFPKESLHFVHSSCAVHWLSRVPEEVMDKTSRAWNKGKIYYSNSTDDVARAYKAQFGKDVENFLELREQEIVCGGLMALVIYGRSDVSSHSETFINMTIEQIENALLDMAVQGKISYEKIDSFNIPNYLASPKEVESIVKRNGGFSVEMMEIVPQEMPQPKVMSSVLRAVFQGMIREHFGSEILDEFFGTILPKKLQERYIISESLESVFLFVLLKRLKI